MNEAKDNVILCSKGLKSIYCNSTS